MKNSNTPAYKKLSIIMPVYNEAKYINKILKKVEEQNIPLKKEIIMVDDCSTDGTRNMLNKLKKTGKYKIFFHNENLGKGFAVRTGLAQSTGDIMIIQDADLEYNPDDYTALLNPILNKKTNVVFGSRFKSQKGNLKENNNLRFFVHYHGNNFLTFLTNSLFFSNLTDMETCYKVFTREVLNKIQPLKSKRFDIEPELAAKILKNGFKITEIPIDYYSRSYKEGKKITWKDGIKAALYIIKYRFFN